MTEPGEAPAVPRLERAIGVEGYASRGPGVGGHLRDDPADFEVREIETVAPESVDADTGDYPHLVVRATLRNWDTNAFARRLSNALGMSRNRVAWAGTKDRRAVTTQLFSLYDVDPADIPEIGGADVEVVGRLGRALQFGDLAGNSFRIVVRDASHPERVPALTAELRAFAGEAETTGGDADGATGTDGPAHVAVPNFFGEQRFGSVRPSTHRVGLRILAGDWRGAVQAYVGSPTEDEPDATRAARERADAAFDSDDPDWPAVIEGFPDHLGYERSILHALVDSGGDEPSDYRTALDALPWNLRRLFVNAAQSFAFNRVLSERLAHGIPFDRPVAGDVVCFTEERNGLTVPDPERTQRVTPERVDVVTRHCERGRAFVTAPLVGTETELGADEPGSIERAVLADLGIDPADFDLPEPYDSTGTRRAILLPTTLRVERDPLAFEFDLPKGSYATVVLREYCKNSPLDR